VPARRDGRVQRDALDVRRRHGRAGDPVRSVSGVRWEGQAADAHGARRRATARKQEVRRRARLAEQARLQRRARRVRSRAALSVTVDTGDSRCGREQARPVGPEA
jgi:hypothetical protein